jgi:hypothetical protein
MSNFNVVVSYNYFRFCDQHATKKEEFMQNYRELHVGRCSIGFGVLENLYLDVKIVFLSRSDKYV